MRNRLATIFLVITIILLGFIAGKINSGRWQDDSAPTAVPPVSAAVPQLTLAQSAPLAPPVQKPVVKSAGAQATASNAPEPPPTPLPLPYGLGVSGNKNWIQNWGLFSFANGIGGATGTIDFGAAASTTGGAAFLGGSGAWTNYAVEMTVDWKMGESFGILARMSDETNFIYCDFGNNYTRIVDRSGGNDTTVGEGITTNGAAGTSEQLGVRLYGDKVACTVAGKDAVTAMAPQVPARGGIGMLSWDPTENNSRVVIRDVEVRAVTSDDIVIAPPAPVASNAPVAAPVVVHPLPYSIGTFGDVFADGDDWLGWWGAVSQTNKELIVGATASSTGGGAWLNGSGGWNNYTVQANVDWVKGESFGIAAQYVDGNNYVLCDFDEPAVGSIYISLRQYVNGQQINLASGRIFNYNAMGGANITAALEVNGNQSACAFNNHAISTAVAGTALSPAQNGGIAFTTWDPAYDNSEIAVHNVGVVKGALNLGTYDDQN